jgi:hypothetical protein
MKLRLILFVFSFLAVPALAHDVVGDPVPGATNKDGSPVTGVLTAKFDPNAGLAGVPIPNNLFYLGTTDLTLNAPTAGLDPTAAALVAQINALDGFSTIERWTTTFVDDGGGPGSIDPGSVIPGQSVRVFQVTSSFFVFVTDVVRELQPGVDYVAVASGNVVAIVPLKPLQEYSSYMAVLTNDIRDTGGNNATPDLTYYLSKSSRPWVDENGNSTYELLDDETAQGAEQLRQITSTMEAAAESQGIPHEDIILSWTVQTQSISPTLGLLRQITQPAPVITAPTPFDTKVVGGRGYADIHIGVITLPYYSGVPSAENPFAPIRDSWTAPPGGYVPPFDQFGLDPTSTNITVANPFPVLTDMQTVPLIITVPNESSLMTKPEGGWPVVIFGHGLGGNRANILLVADALAAAGFVVIGMDFPMHGVTPWDPNFGPFYIENFPFGEYANERTFDVDYIINATGQPGQDDIIDPSGVHALNFQDFRVTRDNARQGITDLSVLAVSVQNIDVTGDGVPDLKPFEIGYGGISWGGIHGGAFGAIEPLVTPVFLNVPAGGLVRAAEASPAFGPRIRGGLAQAGIFPGDPLFELYLTVGQTVADSADPINWVSRLSMAKPTMLHEVIGDTVLPNYVENVPLSGTEPLIRIGGLAAYSTSQANPDGLRSAARFVPPASHGSLMSPASSAAATAEMQGQMATFFGSAGTFIVVGDPSTMLSVVDPAELFGDPVKPRKGRKTRNNRDPDKTPRVQVIKRFDK